MDSKEEIINKINDQEIEYFDDIPKEYQNDEEVIYALIDANDGEPLCSFPEDSIWKKDKKLVMHAIGLYLRIYENELKEEENLHIMYDYAHEDLHNDQDIIDLIGVNPEWLIIDEYLVRNICFLVWITNLISMILMTWNWRV